MIPGDLINMSQPLQPEGNWQFTACIVRCSVVYTVYKASQLINQNNVNSIVLPEASTLCTGSDEKKNSWKSVAYDRCLLD